MRAVIQRAIDATVSVDNKTVGHIDHGMLILLGIEERDTEEEALWLARKCSTLRIFDDDSGVMNLSVKDTDGNALVVSQFTLMASYKKGNRPSFIKAARPEISKPLYEFFCKVLSDEMGKIVEKGVFGAHMKIHFVNDGPVTICMDTNNKE